MAMTGYYKTLIRPRTHRPLSMLKYDPVGMNTPTFDPSVVKRQQLCSMRSCAALVQMGHRTSYGESLEMAYTNIRQSVRRSSSSSRSAAEKHRHTIPMERPDKTIQNIEQHKKRAVSVV